MQETYGSTWSPGPVFWIVWCVVILFQIASMWRVFEKAGKPGWAAIIPIYNPNAQFIGPKTLHGLKFTVNTAPLFNNVTMK